MRNLAITALVVSSLGLLITVIAGATWPKASIYGLADPTLNAAGLSIGGVLLTLGALAWLLLLHAGAVTEAMRDALAADRAAVRREEQAAQRREAHRRA